MVHALLHRLRVLVTPANVIAASLLVVVLGLLGWLRTRTSFDPFTAEGMSALTDDFGWQAPLLFVAAVAIAVVVSQIPGVPLALAAGSAFGILPAFAYTVAGSFLGAMAAYALGRSLGRGVMEVLVGHVVVFRRERGTRAVGWLIFASRALPLFPFDLISYAAGVSAVPLRAYVPATLFGLVPSTLLLTAVGGSLRLGLAWSLAISAVASLALLLAAWATRDRNPWGLRDAIRLERTSAGATAADGARSTRPSGRSDGTRADWPDIRPGGEGEGR